MKAITYSKAGIKKGEVALSKAVFGVKANADQLKDGLFNRLNEFIMDIEDDEEHQRRSHSWSKYRRNTQQCQPAQAVVGDQ